MFVHMIINMYVIIVIICVCLLHCVLQPHKKEVPLNSECLILQVCGALGATHVLSPSGALLNGVGGGVDG